MAIIASPVVPSEGVSDADPIALGKRQSETAKPAVDTETFDYRAAAEFFPTRGRGRRRASYRRFAKAADAIRFTVEELPPELLVGAHLEVDEARFDKDGIRALYESARYPLKRRAPRQ
jgi:hypothetical protein